MSNTDNQTKTIADLIPKNLDEVITLNRDRFSLQMADAHRLAQLPKMIDLLDRDIQVKATINGYWIIELFDAINGYKYFLVGTRRGSFMSSDIQSIDWESGLVLTRNSLYRLGTRGEGEPNFNWRMVICGTFCSWGWGDLLGVLPVFY